MSKKLIGILALVIFFLSAGAIAQKICSQPVMTSEGLVKGIKDSRYPVCAWLGIPYAQPPVGELRFRAPQPPQAHSGILEAEEFGPACLQEKSLFSGGKSIYGYSEDCLTLNIWRPNKKGKFPVMFWIYGGGYTGGASNYEMYNGARLSAEQEVVVVSINYRLNIFGFFAHPEASEENPNHSSGNYGILDQIQALKWVKNNIAHFGGDAENITIFGESAGGVSVCALLASPLTKGLFQRAIIESGACDLFAPIEKGYKDGEEFAKFAGCEGKDVLSCLRAIPAKKLFRKYKASKFPVSGYVDGYVLPQLPIELIKKGEFNQVPVIVGNNRDEMNLFLIPAGYYLLPGFIIKSILKKALGEELYQEVEQLYPRDKFGCMAKRTLIGGNEAFSSRGFMSAEAISDFSTVYLYQFDWDDYPLGKLMGAFHGLEIPFVFGNTRLKRDSLRLVMGTKKVAKKAEPLAKIMMSYWANFARNGNPDGEGLPKWIPYQKENRLRIHFDLPTLEMKPIPPDQLERYQFWASIDVNKLEGFLGGE